MPQVPSGIINVPQSQSGVPDNANLFHAYEQNAPAVVPVGDGLSLQEIFNNIEQTHLHLVVRTGESDSS